MTKRHKQMVRTARRKAIAVKREAAYKKAIRYFRPRKDERNGFVFVDKDGHRRSLSSTKPGYLFYINRNGKKQLLKDKGQRGLPKARSAQTYDITRATSERAIERFIKAEYRQLTSGKSKGSFDRFAMKISDNLRALTGGRGDKNLMIDLRVTVCGKTFALKSEFKKRDLQKMNRTAVGHYVKRKLYAYLGELLDDEGLVSTGSARYIRQLSWNKGKAKNLWRREVYFGSGEKGKLWGKSKNKLVTIEKYEWNISDYILRSGKANK